MTIEMIALAGFVFTAAALAALAYERRMDVLYGPYIEGRSGRAGISIERFWTDAFGRRLLPLESRHFQPRCRHDRVLT